VTQLRRIQPNVGQRTDNPRGAKWHLRVGADTAFPGPACGRDLQGASRTDLTDDPTRVTCGRCQRTAAYGTARRAWGAGG